MKINKQQLVFVTTENCELCNKALKKIRFVKFFAQINEVNVEEGYKDFLIRTPVLLKDGNVIQEGKFSRIKIFKNLFF